MDFNYFVKIDLIMLVFLLLMGWLFGLVTAPYIFEGLKYLKMRWSYRGWSTHVATISKVNKRSFRVDRLMPFLRAGDVLLVFTKAEKDLFGEANR